MKLIYVIILLVISFPIIGFYGEKLTRPENPEQYAQRVNQALMCRIVQTDYYLNNTKHDIFTIYYNRISCIPYYLTHN